ncbi:hypothetical protein [Carboxylicivirga taeanensis]|uniref:hypothetical protein n=1 Tax=Carboxylicivirga taeanensis TaxID=1416875 RepID=UPI003F6DC703
MPSSLRTIIIIAILIATVLPESVAQRRRRSTIWEGFSVTGRLGANHFYGDLVDDGRTHLSLGVNADKELTTFLSARASIMGGEMSGIQLSAPGINNAWFDNTYGEFNVGVTFRPIDVLFGYFKQRSINPYIIGQVGALYYSATKYYGVYGAGFDQEYGSVWNEASGITPTFSGGLGISLWINSQWSVNIEGIGTVPFTDDLDAHKEYEIPGGGVVQTESNDFYYTTSIGITYLIDDSRWRNEPKYNRKAYLKTRSQYRGSSKRNSKAIKRKRRR